MGEYATNCTAILVYADGRIIKDAQVTGAERIDSDGNYFSSVGLAIARRGDDDQPMVRVFVQRPPEEGR